MSKSVFVFGSNEAGIHGKGAALVAYKQHGARFGKSYGHYGDSFAIPTKDENLDTMTYTRIGMYVYGFTAYALGHRKLKFRITQIGCGLAGLEPKLMAGMFHGCPSNCEFDEAWKPFLGEGRTYWGTYA